MLHQIKYIHLFYKWKNQLLKPLKKMKSLQIDPDKAKQLYPTASNEFKAMLEDSFGKSFFNNDWIKLWEKFCKDYNKNIPLPFSHPKTAQEESTNAHHMLIHIVPVKRGNWEPNYENQNEYKYEPRFYMTASGFGFRYAHFDYWFSVSCAGSCLATPSAAVCEAIAVEFLPIYEKWTMYQYNKK